MYIPPMSIKRSKQIKLSYNSKNFIETLFVRFKIKLCAKGYHVGLTNMSYQEYCWLILDKKGY